MALPASGPISASQVNDELDRESMLEHSLQTAQKGVYATINTNNDPANRPDITTPYAMSEWYSYDHDKSGFTTSGLVSHLDPTDVVNSTITDQSGNSNTGTMTNGTSVVTAGGITYFNLDGTNDYINWTTLDNDDSSFTGGSGTRTFSMGCWLYRDNGSTNHQEPMGWLGTDSRKPMGMHVVGSSAHYGRTNTMGLFLYGGNKAEFWYANSSTHSTDTWENWCITISGTSPNNVTPKIYKNGVLQTISHVLSQNASSWSQGSNVWRYVGAGRGFRHPTSSSGTPYSAAYQWNGRLGNMWWYSDVLTATEVLANYNAQKGSYGL